MSRYYLVRYLLGDGTTVKAGGHRYPDAARAQVQWLMSDEVRDTRAANGALVIASAWAVAPDGKLVAEAHQLGHQPTMTA